MSTSHYLTETLGNAAHASARGAVHFVCMDWRHAAELTAVSGRLRSRANVWWWKQSSANWSQRADSLLTGKITGNFIDFVRTDGSETLLSPQESKTYSRIPCEKEQGIFAGLAGNFSRRRAKLTTRRAASKALLAATQSADCSRQSTPAMPVTALVGMTLLPDRRRLLRHGAHLRQGVLQGCTRPSLQIEGLREDLTNLA